MADSIALASQRADSAGPYSANGENSPHPAGPWMSAPSRTVMPRNFVRIGMANARSVASSPGKSLMPHARTKHGLAARGSRLPLPHA